MNYSITPLDSNKYLTLVMAKKHLRIDGTDEDELITESIEASIAQVENHCAVIFGERDFVLKVPGFTSKINLPFYPVNSITSVVYKDKEGADQTLPVASYNLFALQQDHSNSVRILGNLPETETDNPEAVIITGKIGLVKVPGDVKKAVKLLCGDADTYREDRPMAGTDRAVSQLLRPYKY
jgi:uncharacterized phiE125 gp8 family phage protein